MYLIVGLGNPDAEYTGTRHNVGREMVRTLAEDWKREKKMFADVAKHDGVLYALPTTYMNESGKAVAKIISNFQFPISNIVLVHDDIDLPLGALRISKNASAGGHNGVQSIIDALGTNAFVRLRIGVAGMSRARTDAATYVLKRFTKSEHAALAPILARAREALTTILRDGVDTAMNTFNRK